MAFSGGDEDPGARWRAEGGKREMLYAGKEAERFGPLPNGEAPKNPSPAIHWALWDMGKEIREWFISPSATRGPNLSPQHRDKCLQ